MNKIIKKIKHYKINRKILAGVCIISLVLSIFIAPKVASAIWNSSNATHIKADEIENSTFIIGTHLIHINGLTEELFKIAKQSAIDSEQETIYYKSELAEGAWVDIGGASTVNDLSVESKSAVDNTVIEGLFLEYHTKSDGITYDLKNNSPINIFNLQTPYELELMEELEPIETQYEILKEKAENDDFAKKMKNIIGDFFSTNVQDEYTKNCDNNLSSVQRYYEVLAKNNGKDSSKEVVSSLMSKIDSDRRGHIFEKVEEELINLADKITKLSSPSDNKDEDKEEEEKTAGSDTDVQTAIATAQGNVSDSLNTCNAGKLLKGTTVISYEEYNVSSELIEHSKALQDNLCDVDADKLSALKNINENDIVDKSFEIKYLMDDLMIKMDQEYIKVLSAGINDDYKNAIRNNSSNAVLNTIINNNKTSLALVKSQLEYFIDAITLRCETDEGITYINQRIKDITKFTTVIPKDSFSDSAKSNVNEHLEWLNKKLSELEASKGSSGGDLEKLKNEKVKLNEEKMAALDKNDLDTAKKIDKLIEAKDKEIEQKEKEVTSTISSLNEELSKLQEELNNADPNDTDKINDLNKKIGDINSKLATSESLLNNSGNGGSINTLKKQGISLLAALNKNNVTGSNTGDGSDGSNGSNGSDGSSGSDGNNGNDGNDNGNGSGITDSSVSNTAAEIEGIIDSLNVFMDTNTSQVYEALKELYGSLLTEKYLNDLSAFDTALEKIEDIIAKNADKIQSSTDKNNILSPSDINNLLKDMKDKLLSDGQLGENSKNSAKDMSENQIDAALAVGLGLYCENTAGNNGNGTSDGSDGNNGDGSSDGSDGSNGNGSSDGSDGNNGDGSSDGSDGSNGNGSSDGSDGSNGNGSSDGSDGSNGNGSGSGNIKIDEGLNNKLNAYATDLLNNGNKRVFEKINTTNSRQYVPCTALSVVLTDYRYIWSDSLKTALFVNKESYYEFEALKSLVIRSEDKSKTDELKVQNEFKGVVYIDDTYTTKEFGYSAFYLGNTKYGIIVNDKEMELAYEICDILVQEGEK